MVKKSKGYRSRTRILLKKKPRERGKLGLNRLLRNYVSEEKVSIKIDPSVHKGMPHRRYHGKIATIMEKRGRSYVIEVPVKKCKKDIDFTSRTYKTSKSWLIMPKKIINIEEITISQAKGLMEKNDPELGELQKRTYDYIAKFSKFKTIKIKKLVKELVTKFDLSKKEAIQVVNCAPASVDELRAILSVKGKVILIDQLEAIIELIGKENKQPELKKTIKTKKQ